ncbi:hypothetical protein [Rheinheimera sp.]|uniref:hypothetical protein n=1 Tax=Rheinheimera sp. TaxID=1869214 RepID=UPI0027BA3282|nr:hypothetical protein [Rheinheimera sp.]
MGLLRHLHKAPIRVLRLQRRKSMIRIRFSMIRLKTALSQEKAETRQMLRIYQNYLSGEASKADLAVANNQLADVLRATGLGIFAILPFAPVTIPLIVKLGRKLGIEVMPSAFAPTAKKTVSSLQALPEQRGSVTAKKAEKPLKQG